MSDRADSKSGLVSFLSKFTTPVVGIISLITTLHNFTKLFADKDVELLTIIFLTIGILLLVGICLYYARFWQPELGDKGSSGFVPAPTDEQVKRQHQKERQRKLIRRVAVAGLVLVPLLSLGGFARWQHLQSQPSKDVLILVADFEGPDPQNYFVTKTIVESLESATESYADVSVKRLDKILRQRQEAHEAGKQQKASIVIWGSYGKTKDTVPISVNFELLNPPKYLPELGAEAKGKVRIAPIAELENSTLQIRLSNEMGYLTLFTLGMAQYAKGDVDGAITRFSNALAQIDTTASFLNQSIVFFYRGSSYYSKGDHSKAISDFTEAIKFQPNLSGAYYNRGNSHLFKNDYLGAIADFTQAIKLKPNLAAAYNNRGVVYGAQGNYPQAFADLNQAIKLNPNDAGAYSNRGNVYDAQGNYPQAIADFNQAIQLQYDNANAYNNRGDAYRAQGNYPQAISDFNQVIKFHPRYALAYYNRGLTYTEQGKHPQAIADFNQAIQLKSDYADAYIGRGAAYVHQGNYTQAIADYTQAIKLNPDNVLAYYNRGNVYGTQTNYTQAIADFSQAIQLKPDYSDAYIYRGAVYVHQGNYNQAIADFNQVIKLKPDYAGAYYSKACIYGLQRDVKAALENLQRAIDLDAGFRDLAKTDSYFDNIRQERQFQALVGQ